MYRYEMIKILEQGGFSSAKSNREQINSGEQIVARSQVMTSKGSVYG